ncbi:hypothetical protein [Cellulomonas sp. URHE0023]|uniref:hypothetical protein n=1 Tax=Cellulomonas sp. URHE0023 TaxID=1380354 RepID=UPI0012DF87FD|nr:hypothetical protein [Cellulomonas sp. URHE0023]
MTATAVPRAAAAPLLMRNRIGLVILGLLGLVDMSAFAFPMDDDAKAGPPTGILVLDTILGIATVAFVVVALRTRSRGAIRIVAGLRIVSVLSAVPAFFAPVPPALVTAAALDVVVTFVGIVLALTPPRRAHPVLD